MKKKIKDLTLKEFYLMWTESIEEIRPYCFGKESIEFLADKTISKYLEDKGETEVEVDESNND